MRWYTSFGVVILFLIYVVITYKLFRSKTAQRFEAKEYEETIEFTDEAQIKTTVTNYGEMFKKDEKTYLSSERTSTPFGKIDPSLKGEPRQHIAFLKVHKAASSTAQNILLRYGYTRNLTFVLPRPPKFFYPNIISTITSVNERNVLPPPASKNYDILCCHVIYNRKAFETIMPKDTVYIGIVREPSEHIRSIIQYFRPSEIYRQFKNSLNPISEFFKNPNLSVRNNTRSYLNNRMAFEYDFPKNLFQSKDIDGINKYLRKLAEEFHLVIIVEYFDESLVLMRRILNWSIKDILYIKQNQSKKSKAPKLSLEDKILHRKWAVLEYALYDFFFKRLWDQIKREGNDFIEELSYFKSLRNDVIDFCLDPSRINSTFKVPKSAWSNGFIVSDFDCELMFQHEIKFVQSIRLFQYGDLNYGMLNDTTYY